MKGWTSKERIRAWAMVLFAISFFCRSSCLTTFCPLVEDMKYPASEGAYCKDGIPEFIVIVWTNWKSRSHSKRNQPYRLHLHRNHVNANFCPVTWLCMYLALYKITKGPIFQTPSGDYLSPMVWTRMVYKIFDEASKQIPGLEKCTTHSMRRSGAIWAGRCRAPLSVVRMTGRWKSIEILMKYLHAGTSESQEHLTYGTTDPQEKTWVFKDPTVAVEIALDGSL